MDAVHTRVRFAPSPTGYLHIGGARTALYNWLYARQTGGAFILRIEDTDSERSTTESYESIIDALQWLKLDWDEGPEKGGEFGPYLQSSRVALYLSEAEKLLENRSAYRCFCTRIELEEIRKTALKMGKESKYDGKCRNLPDDESLRRLDKKTPHVIRFKIPPGTSRFNDIIHGPLVFDNDELDDFVLIKSDGKPAYNFAAAVDDARMRISHVIRGDDHIPNTPKQVLLYKALGYDLPKFAHLPMILGQDRSRLSKRHGAASVQEFRRMGYMSDALVNYLALLGWAYDDRSEFFTPGSLVKKFSLKKVSKNPAAFDMGKLNHINGEHFKRIDIKEKASMVIQALETTGVLPPDFRVREWGGADDISANAYAKKGNFGDEVPRLAVILEVMGNRLKNAGDAPALLRCFYKDDYEKDPDAYSRYIGAPETAVFLRKLSAVIGNLDVFDRPRIEKAVRSLAESLDVKAARLIHPCRVALTGKSVSPDIFSVIQLLGKNKTVERLEAAAGYAAGRT